MQGNADAQAALDGKRFIRTLMHVPIKPMGYR